MAQAAVPPIGPSLGSSVPGFGTDGIRGRAGSVLTPALCLQVGYWFGRALSQPGPVLIGMDSRSSGSMVASALTAGLTAAGREVWSLGLCATPAVPLLIRQVGAAGGLMVSASHHTLNMLNLENSFPLLIDKYKTSFKPVKAMQYKSVGDNSDVASVDRSITAPTKVLGYVQAPSGRIKSNLENTKSRYLYTINIFMVRQQNLHLDILYQCIFYIICLIYFNVDITWKTSGLCYTVWCCHNIFTGLE